MNYCILGIAHAGPHLYAPVSRRHAWECQASSEVSSIETQEGLTHALETSIESLEQRITPDNSTAGFLE